MKAVVVFYFLLSIASHACITQAQFKEKHPDYILGKEIPSTDFSKAKGSLMRLFHATDKGDKLIAKFYPIEHPHKFRSPFREALFLDKFNHLPGTVDFYSCIYSEKNVTIIIEEMGKDLRDELHVFGNQTWAQRAEWFIILADTIEEFHDGERIHSDIKLNNFMFTIDRKKVKVIDFGFSVHINTQVAGWTTSYAAPEVVKAKVLYEEEQIVDSKRRKQSKRRQKANAKKLKKAERKIKADPTQDIWSFVLVIIYGFSPQTYQKMNLIKKKYYRRDQDKFIYKEHYIEQIRIDLEALTKETGLPFITEIFILIQVEIDKRPTMSTVRQSLNVILEEAKKRGI